MQENNTVNYSELDVPALSSKLAQMNALHEEVLEEREMILGQTGHHIASTRLFNDYRNELQRITDDIQLIKTLIREKSC